MSDIESRVEQLERTVETQKQLSTELSRNFVATTELLIEIVHTTNQLQQRSIDDQYDRAQILRTMGVDIPELTGEKEYLARQSG